MDTGRATESGSPTWSTPAIAEMLGTSLPRIHRALRALELSPRYGPKGHLALTRDEVAALQAKLGRAPRGTGFSREELFVLHALYHRPFGLRSARAVARDAGVAPATASKVLSGLRERALVERRTMRVVEGRVVDVTVWKLRLQPYWLNPDIRCALAATVPPSPAAPRDPDHLPRRFRHLFWNAPPEAWRLPAHAGAIATTILEQTDTDALSWAAQVLPIATFQRIAAGRRGTTARTRRFAANVAAARRP